MKHERFGSYSIASTVAGTPSFVRLKSMIRYSFLLPPPRCLAVMTPWWLRPCARRLPTVSDFSGSNFVRTFL